VGGWWWWWWLWRVCVWGGGGRGAAVMGFLDDKRRSDGSFRRQGKQEGACFNVHEEGGIVAVVVEALGVGDARLERVGNRATSQDGTTSLGKQRQEGCLTKRQRLGANTCGPRVGHVVGADAERCEDCCEGTEDQDPLVLFELAHGDE
jgi:hypothetical protein